MRINKERHYLIERGVFHDEDEKKSISTHFFYPFGSNFDLFAGYGNG